MKCISAWKESKFVLKEDGLHASAEVGAGSWLMAELIANEYTKLIPQYAKGKLLDLGCGAVPLYGYYQKYISDNVCVDWDNSLHSNKYLDISMDISEPLPFEMNSFDTIICSDVLEHIYTPGNVISEMIRICNHGGYIILNVPFGYWMHERPYDYNRMTKFFYQRFADEHKEDIELISIQPLGGCMAVLVDKYAKIALSHRWMLGKAVQKFYYKHWLKRDNADTDTLGFFVVFKKV